MHHEYQNLFYYTTMFDIFEYISILVFAAR